MYKHKVKKRKKYGLIIKAITTSKRKMLSTIARAEKEGKITFMQADIARELVYGRV